MQFLFQRPSNNKHVGKAYIVKSNMFSLVSILYFPIKYLMQVQSKKQKLYVINYLIHIFVVRGGEKDKIVHKPMVITPRNSWVGLFSS